MVAATSNLLPSIATRAIGLTAQAGVPLVVPHGLGRSPVGWLVIWNSGPIAFSVFNPALDDRQQLVLLPDADADVRVVLL